MFVDTRLIIWKRRSGSRLARRRGARLAGEGALTLDKVTTLEKVPVLNQGDQGGNLIPPSLILIPDIPDIPEVPWVPSGPGA